MERIVDIATDGLHLSAHRGFLKVEQDRSEVGRVALDDIAAVIVHAHGTTYSNNLLVALAKRNAILVACGSDHAPAACLWPISGHHLQAARMRAQWTASKPLMKRIWQQIVRRKIAFQASVAAASNSRSGGIEALARKVKSGDPENVEAQAARRYWPLIFGPDFRRDRYGDGPNPMLNYGYTVLRATASRAIVSAGLHPTIGIHHANQYNDFSLSDDLMEPFRPLVDWVVKSLVDAGAEEVNDPVKSALTQLMACDLDSPRGASPVFACVQRGAQSLAAAFESGTATLDLPEPPTPLTLQSLARYSAAYLAQ